MQRVNLKPGKASFTVYGPDVTPRTPEWSGSGAASRAAYWPILASWVKRAMIQQLAAGLGADGKPLPPPKAVSREWYMVRRKEWRGPSMSPQFGASRFQRHLRVVPFPSGPNADRVVGFWSHGAAKIAHWHATGTAGRGVPIRDGDGRLKGFRGLPGQTTGIVRDVVGVSPGWLAWAVQGATRDWQERYGRGGPATANLILPLPHPATLPPAQRPAASAAQALLDKYPFLGQFNPTDPLARPKPVPPPRGGAVGRILRRVAAALGGLFS